MGVERGTPTPPDSPSDSVPTPEPEPGPDPGQKQALDRTPKDEREQPVSGGFHEPDDDEESVVLREPDAAIADPAKARGVSLGLRRRLPWRLPERSATARLTSRVNVAVNTPLERKGGNAAECRGAGSASGSMKTVLLPRVWGPSRDAAGGLPRAAGTPDC